MNEVKVPPVKMGDQILLEIIGRDSDNHPNDRIAKVENYIVFIKDCCEEVGEKINVEITAALPKYGFAKLVKE